tara:strand:- start:751 stop:1041 length:291 start_codon:yes stop_codon:yes gene_type:complete
MITKHEIIVQLYKHKGVEVVYGEEDGTFTAARSDGTIIPIDQNAVDAEFSRQEYKNDRWQEYPSIEDQLDYIYHNGIDKWKTDIVDPVKAKYPKPE